MMKEDNMSYWISLEHPETEETAEVSNHSEGGTYAIGGINEASLNVTYNYGKHFRFRSLNKQTGEKTIELLEAAVKKLGTVRHDDYWESTPGNCSHTCNILLQWAKEHPSYVWRVN